MAIPRIPASLREIGGSETVFQLAETHAAALGESADLVLLRVIEQHRSSFVLSDGVQNYQGNAHPKLKQKTAVLKPCVGDFVWFDARLSLFSQVLPRQNALKRAAAGERHAEQLLAANIDRVLIVCGMDRDYSERRIERYLALVQGSGIAATVLLSKADTRPDAAEVLSALQQRLAASCTVRMLDTRDPLACEPLRLELPAGSTGVLLGSSGAGKSTLSNTLAGQIAMQTGAVRESDGRGRHTTVHRALLKLSWGACLIDSPGLREIKLTGEEQIEQASFPEIAEYALHCKFRDCLHEAEPGCRVRRAIAEGELALDRLHSYKKLSAELEATQKRVAAQQQQGARPAQKRLRR